MIKQSLIVVVFGLAGMVWTVSCTDNQETPAPEIVAITPPDGATAVAKTTAIQVEFSETMDRSSCESRFGLFLGNLDSIPVNMAGMMAGEFGWNGDGTVMTFHPDSLLMDSTMYSICLQEGMMADHDHGMMMSGMMDHGQQVTGGIISRFTTQ
jgi:hypothetical protein